MNYCTLLIVDITVFEIFSKFENEKIPFTTNAKNPFNKLL